jgi:hypothetical protein
MKKVSVKVVEVPTKKIFVLLDKVNVPRIVGDHLFNKSHSDMHRMLTGVVIMSIGVVVSKIHFTLVVFQLIIDGVGYGIHGIGLTPFIEKITYIVSGENKKPPRVK